MARTCTICTHPKREKIEAAINNGDSGKSIASRAAVHPSTVTRHKTNHMAPLKRVQARRSNDKPSGSADRVEQMYDDVRALLDNALAHGMTQTSLQAIKELRQTVELLAKLRGELSNTPQVVMNVIANPEWLAMRALVMEFVPPEQRHVLAGRIRELEARRANTG